MIEKERREDYSIRRGRKGEHKGEEWEKGRRRSVKEGKIGG